MAKAQALTTKRLEISKANAQIVGVAAAAAFVTIFCLFAFKAEFSQNRYNARVTTAKEKAHHQLQNNIQTSEKLSKSYKKFDSQDPNIINGNPSGTGDNDGRNSKLILNALPSAYDFPALASSIEKILTNGGFNVTKVSGIDNQLSQQSNANSPNPQAVSMPFSFEVSNANYASLGQLMAKLQQSIRPIQVDSIDLSGGATSMTLTVNAHTYFQPAKNVNITKKVVK